MNMVEIDHFIQSNLVKTNQLMILCSLNKYNIPMVSAILSNTQRN